MRENKHNQVVVINATLTRIERWFGAFHASTIPNGQVVLLLPEGLAFCQHCRRVRLTSSMLADGTCQHCKSVASIDGLQIFPPPQAGEKSQSNSSRGEPEQTNADQQAQF